MQTALSRWDVILFKLSFALGMFFLFFVIFGQVLPLRVSAWAWLILACWYPIHRTPAFRGNWYLRAVTVINFVIILLIALNDRQGWRLALAGGIVTVSIIHHVILTFDAMGNIRRETREEARAETIAEIKEKAAHYLSETTDPPAHP